MLIAVGWLVLMVVGFYLIAVRPQRRRMMELRMLQDDLAVGDEVMLSAGIYGTITGLGDDTVDLAIAPGTTVTVARGAVSMRVGDDEEVDAGESPAGPGDPPVAD